MDKRIQVGGTHYSKREVQPWDVILEYGLDFWLGNVIKYVMRAADKNGVEDLRKAKHYLEYRIWLEEGGDTHGFLKKLTPSSLSSAGSQLREKGLAIKTGTTFLANSSRKGSSARPLLAEPAHSSTAKPSSGATGTTKRSGKR